MSLVEKIGCFACEIVSEYVDEQYKGFMPAVGNKIEQKKIFNSGGIEAAMNAADMVTTKELALILTGDLKSL